jgi:hypothetical protein
MIDYHYEDLGTSFSSNQILLIAAHRSIKMLERALDMK